MKEVSFQPENAHSDLSTIPENRPSPPRNIIVKNQESERKSKKDRSPDENGESEGLRFITTNTGSLEAMSKSFTILRFRDCQSRTLHQPDCTVNINIQQKLTRQNKGINQERREYGMWKTGKPTEKQDKRNPQNGVEGRVHLKAWYTAGLERIWSRQVQCLRLQVR